MICCRFSNIYLFCRREQNFMVWSWQTGFCTWELTLHRQDHLIPFQTFPGVVVIARRMCAAHPLQRWLMGAAYLSIPGCLLWVVIDFCAFVAVLTRWFLKDSVNSFTSRPDNWWKNTLKPMCSYSEDNGCLTGIAFIFKTRVGTSSKHAFPPTEWVCNIPTLNLNFNLITNTLFKNPKMKAKHEICRT